MECCKYFFFGFRTSKSIRKYIKNPCSFLHADLCYYWCWSSNVLYYSVPKYYRELKLEGNYINTLYTPNYFFCQDQPFLNPWTVTAVLSAKKRNSHFIGWTYTQVLRRIQLPGDKIFSVKYHRRPRWSRGYHTRHWIRGLRIQARPG